MFILRNDLAEVLLIVSLLERYDPQEAPSQQRLFDAYYGNVNFDDSGKRKKIASVFRDFLGLCESLEDVLEFKLTQNNRKKYYLDFDDAYGVFKEESVNCFDNWVIRQLTEDRLMLIGVGRDYRQQYEQGLLRFLDESPFPYHAYLITVLSLAIRNTMPVELRVYDPLQRQEIESVIQPISLRLGSVFYLTAETHKQSGNYQAESVEETIDLNQITDIYLVITDTNCRI